LIAQIGRIDVATIASQVEAIGPGCFEGRPALLSVVFASESCLWSIDERAFARCPITSIDFPGDLETIGPSAFQWCNWLKRVTFRGRPRLYSIGAYAFWDAALTEIALPESITNLGAHCLPTNCDISLSSSLDIPELTAWNSASLANPDTTMTRNLHVDFHNLSEILFRLEDYELVRPLGAGGYAEVKLYVHKRTGVEVAVKLLKFFSPQDDRASTSFIREVAILRELEHPCVIQLKGVSLSNVKDLPLIAMAYVSGGSLDIALRDKPQWFTPTAKAIIIARIVLEMIYVHAQNVLHRDLKPVNILLDEAGSPRIGDFGISKFQDVESGMTAGVVGTLYYIAPECFDDEYPFTNKVDVYARVRHPVYAFAIMLYEVVTGRLAFDIKAQHNWKHIANLQKGHRPAKPATMSPKMCELLDDAWKQQPQERISFAEVFIRLSCG
jgi:serine/threonine protein kinase